MITEVYDALHEVGVSEKKRGVPPRRWQSKSRRLTSIETRLGSLDSRLTGWRPAQFMQCQIDIIAALQIAALVKLFIH